MIPKSDKKTLARIQKAVAAADSTQVERKNPAEPKAALRNRDIDRMDDETYQDCMFVNAAIERCTGYC